MTAILSRRGQVSLPKCIRLAAKLRPGDVLEVKCERNGHIVLRRARKSGGSRSGQSLLNVKPFPPGTLKAIYQQPDPEWEAIEAAAALAQPAPSFDE
jgi:AbrB family looped-hinge helix DNA binding protein